MKLHPGEHRAIKEVLHHGATYGYGNLIAHLQTAWARRLMESGMSEAGARTHAGPGYPFIFWDDLLENGEWDETGKRYTKKGKKK